MISDKKTIEIFLASFIPEEQLDAVYFEALVNYPCKYFVAKEITEDT